MSISTANIITLSRLPLLLAVVGLLYLPWGFTTLAALALLPVLYLMDWFDGYWARSNNQVSDLGGVLDIAIDRVVENVLWLVFAQLERAPVWVPILFIVRSFVVDGLRGYALAKGYSAFGMMRSRWGRFLVAGRFMRGLYGLAKGLAFGALAALLAVERGAAWLADPAWLRPAAGILVYASVALCLARGAPVLFDIRGLLGAPAPPPPQA
ncbi:MAG: CDP-alcohol phosphatidyltransferase family protein [Thermodesulfobacteriota bacterium]